MFGSAILETALGLLFIYFVYSTISSSLSEGVARLLRWRAKNLKAAVENMLQNENLVIDFFQNDMIKTLGEHSKGRLPSYMRSKDFARGLLSVIADKDGQVGPLSVQRIQNILNSGRPELTMIKKGLTVLVSESGMDFSRLSGEVEEWFNSVMERAQGWYKRRLSMVIIAIASVLTVASNADTIMMLNILWSSSSTRSAVAALSEDLTVETPDEERQLTIARDAYDIVNQSLLGWVSAGPEPAGLAGFIQRRPPAYDCASGDGACLQNFAFAWLAKLLGLILTVAAVSMGAPFWFDLINKVTNLRSSGGRPIADLLTSTPGSPK